MFDINYDKIMAYQYYNYYTCVVVVARSLEKSPCFKYINVRRTDPAYTDFSDFSRTIFTVSSCSTNTTTSKISGKGPCFEYIRNIGISSFQSC